MSRIPQKSQEIVIADKNAMRAFWNDLKFQPRQILLLRGEVGSGKTQSVLWLAERFGAHDAASPSFALHNVYAIGGDRPVIDHFDLYRLRDTEDLESTGFWDVFAKNEGLVIIEWPENLNIDHLPTQWAITEVEIKNSMGDSVSEERIIIIKNFN
jgi:tRNA threonylcarbamoyladenosine biosynthesis protein TsaE